VDEKHRFNSKINLRSLAIGFVTNLG